VPAEDAALAGDALLAGGAATGGAGGWAGPAGAGAWAGGAIAPVTVWAAELTTDPAVLATEPAALLRGLLAAEVATGPADAGPVSAEAADVTAGIAPGCSLPAAA
jgi:hypothetical protein